MLNVKQEKFIQNIANGMSQREAYKDAYNAKYKNDAIDNKASKLFNKAEIKARYSELMAEIKDEAIMTAIDRRKWLTNVINGKIKDADLNTKMKAMDILNKMDGEYVTNHKISGDKDNPLNIIDLSHLSTDEIRELLKNEN